MDLTIQDQACIDESVNVAISGAADEYSEDFCHQDLMFTSGVHDVQNLTGFNAPQAIEILYDSGKWFGFIGSKSTDELFRLDFGNSLEESPDIVNLGNFGIADFKPNAIEHIKIDNKWYGIVISQHGRLYRFQYSSGLQSSVSVTSLGDLGPWLVVWDTDLIYDPVNDSWILAVLDSSGKFITMIDFGDLISDTPISMINVTNENFSNPTGIELEHTNGVFYLFVTDQGADRVFKASFGSDPITEPTFVEILAANNPNKIEIVKEGLNYTGLVLQSNEGLIRIDFGDNFGSTRVTPLGTYGGLLNPGNGFVLVRDFPSYKAFVIDWFNRVLTRVDFSANCSDYIVSRGSGQLYVTYQQPGKKYIEILSKDDFGNISIVWDTIEVIDQIAPEIVYNYDGNCVLESIMFGTEVVSDSEISTYSWDFNDDGIEDSNEESPQVSFDTLGGVGTYTVRLDVTSAAGCSNFVEQEIKIYPEPPIPSFDVIADVYCAQNEIAVSNTTDDASYDGLVAYHWSITDLGDSTTGDWTVQFANPGEKIIEVYSSIPGCESVVVRDTITIFDAPFVDFTSSETCLGDLTTFTNVSSATSYEWDFGDGFLSTATSPDHLYEAAGTYTVTLTGTDVNGCPNEIQHQVTVNNLPVADFNYPQLCVNESANFTDLSLVNGGSIVGWEWYVDNEVASTQQNPEITFENSGTHEIRLIAYGSNNCDGSTTVMVEVEEEQQLDLNISPGCIGETTVAEDLTDYGDNQVQSRLWLVDGVLIDNENDVTFNRTIAQAGDHLVTLIVNLDNGCSAVEEEIFNIPTNPQFSFSSMSLCDNEQIVLEDTTQQVVDNEVLGRTWFVDGQNIGNGETVITPVLSAGSHELQVLLETAFGCEISVIENLEVEAAPNPAFTISTDYGVPPFNLTATNQSVNASNYNWYLDDELISSAQNLSTQIADTGQKQLKLVAYNEFGCADSTGVAINSSNPLMDLVLEQIQLTENGSQKEIRIQVRNGSNLPVEVVDFYVTLENKFTLSERVYQRINIGQRAVIKLNTTVPSFSTAIGYLCVSGQAIYDTEDVNPVDNEACLFISGTKGVVEPPYPNPASESTSIHVILPEKNEVTVSVFDLSGDEIIREYFPDSNKGLNVFEISLVNMEAGTYIINVDYGLGTNQFRVIKQ